VSLVVDASVAAKWVLPEPESERAEELRRSGEALLAPTLVVAEIGNAVWKRAVRGDLSSAEAIDAVATATALFTALTPMEHLAARATEIAIELNHPIYDCFYLALAERERAPIISADAKLLGAAKKMKGVEGRKL
jgi:predicted nucleic acid-binding protein